MCDAYLENVLGERLVGTEQSRGKGGTLAPKVMPRQSELNFKGWAELRKVWKI